MDYSSHRHDRVPLAIGIVVVVWLVLSFTNQTTKFVELLGTFLPPWYATVNLLIAPVLPIFAAGPLRIPPALRLALMVLLLWSISALSLGHGVHPKAYYVSLILVLAEAFWLIPKWNARRRPRLD